MAKGASGHQLPESQEQLLPRPEREARLIFFPGTLLQDGSASPPGQGTHKALPEAQRQPLWLELPADQEV